jgi:hypothetical protein
VEYLYYKSTSFFHNAIYISLFIYRQEKERGQAHNTLRGIIRLSPFGKWKKKAAYARGYGGQISLSYPNI